jgi:hypothetical protein
MRQPQLTLVRKLPTPIPADVRHNPTAEEFDLWSQHPVTRWVAKAYAIAIDAHIAAWSDLLGQKKTPEELAQAQVEYRTRADAYNAFLQTTHADYLRRIDETEWKEIYG